MSYRSHFARSVQTPFASIGNRQPAAPHIRHAKRLQSLLLDNPQEAIASRCPEPFAVIHLMTGSGTRRVAQHQRGGTMWHPDPAGHCHSSVALPPNCGDSKCFLANRLTCGFRRCINTPARFKPSAAPGCAQVRPGPCWRKRSRSHGQRQALAKPRAGHARFRDRPARRV